MPDLPANTVTYEGLTFGGKNQDFAILSNADEGVAGLDLPEFRTTLNVRQGHGAVGGAQWSDVANPRFRVWTKHRAKLMQLRAAMKPRPNPVDEVPWSFGDLGFGGSHRLWVRPELCQFRVTSLGLHAAVWLADVGWVAADPTIFTEDAVEYPFTPAAVSRTVTVDNTGLSRSESGRAWTLTITAGAGGATSPFIERVDDPDVDDQRVEWSGNGGLTLTAGQTLTVNSDRTSKVGTAYRDGYVRSGTTGNQRGPDWPTFPPGTSTVRVGCATGTVTAALRLRGTD